MVKALLSAANAFLTLLNAPVGTFATQMALLTGLFWGATGLIKAMQLIPAFIADFTKNIVATTSAMTANAAATASATGATSSYTVATMESTTAVIAQEAAVQGTTGAMATATGVVSALGAAFKALLPIVAGIGLAFGVFATIADIGKIDTSEATAQLNETRSAIEEINTEYDKLIAKANDGSLTRAEERRLAILEKQLEIKKQQEEEDYKTLYQASWGESGENTRKAQSTTSDLDSAIHSWEIYTRNLENFGEVTDKNRDKFERFVEQQRHWESVILEQSEALGELVDDLQEYKDSGIVELEDEQQELIDQYPELLEWMEEVGIISSETAEQIQDANKAQVESFTSFEEGITNAQSYASDFAEQLDSLQGDYEALTQATNEYNTTGEISANTLATLIDRDINLAQALEVQNDKLGINNEWIKTRGENLVEEAKRELTAQTMTELHSIAVQDLGGSFYTAGTQAENNSEFFGNFASVLEQVASGAIGAGAAMNYLWTSMSPEEQGGATFSEEAKAAMDEVINNYKTLYNSLGSGLDWATYSGGSVSGSSGSSSKETDPIQAQVNAYKDQNELIEWNLELKEREGASLDELIQGYRDYQAALKQQEQALRDMGLDENDEEIRDIIDAWWDAEDAIQDYIETGIEENRDFVDDLISDTKDFISDRKALTDMEAKDELKIWEELMRQIDALQQQGLIDYEYYLEQRKEITQQILELQKEIADQEKEAAEEAAEAAHDAYIEGLERRQEAYEKFFSYMADRIQDEIDALEEQRDKEEEYWDDKIEALQEQNDEIERQIQLEQLQASLAAARQSKVMVYKDGRFQYIQDIDEISEAQANLESYQREEALRQEVENLEKLKEQALASIDQQIKAWEEYKEQWSSVVDNYQEEQDRLLIEQELGIKLEGDLWKERLDNLESYVSQYEALMGRLSAAASGGFATGGGSYNEDGWNTDYIASGGLNSIGNEWANKVNSASGGSSGGRGSYDGSSASWKDVLENPGTPSRDDPDYDMYYYLVDNGAPPDVIRGEQYRVESGIKDKYTEKKNKHAKGTLNSPAGISLVGEEGPELRVLNQGDGIIPADVTKNLWSWGEMSPYDFMNKITAYQTTGGRTTTNVIENLNISLPNVKNGEEFAQYCKENLWRTAVQKEAV